MGSSIIDTGARAKGRDRASGESYPLEVARRAIAAQTAADPEPLDDPWFVEEAPVEASREDPFYEHWVTELEIHGPPRSKRPPKTAASLAALYFL